VLVGGCVLDLPEDGGAGALPRPPSSTSGEMPRLLPAEMLLDCLVAQAHVCIGAAVTPTTCDRRDIAAPAGARTLPANRVHVLACAKETPYKRDPVTRSYGSLGKWRWRRFPRRNEGLRAVSELEQGAQACVLGRARTVTF